MISTQPDLSDVFNRDEIRPLFVKLFDELQNNSAMANVIHEFNPHDVLLSSKLGRLTASKKFRFYQVATESSIFKFTQSAKVDEVMYRLTIEQYLSPQYLSPNAINSFHLRIDIIDNAFKNTSFLKATDSMFTYATSTLLHNTGTDFNTDMLTQFIGAINNVSKYIDTKMVERKVEYAKLVKIGSRLV